MPPQSGDEAAPPLPEGLRWCSDEAAGLNRRRCGRGFAYRDARGKPVRDTATLRRIKALAIPPAWTDVWICPFASGHIQATGRDARGRKQYRYHPDWITAQSRNKFERLPLFATRLPRLERALEAALARRGNDAEKVVATAVRLMQLSLIRVGNAHYSRENRSYGLTTLRKKHLDITGTELRLHFRGKSGVVHDVSVQDRRLANMVRRLNELPGQILFQYADPEGQLRPVTSDTINGFIRQHMGDDFSAKDFRTWAATVSAARALCECEAPASPTAAKREINNCVRTVARLLGNTPAVCRSAYIHPRVLSLFEAGIIRDVLPSVDARSFDRALARLLQDQG